MTKTLSSLALAILAFGTTNAFAQGTGTSPVIDTPQVRKGLMLGFGVGGGNISAECGDSDNICDEVLESGSFSGHVGVMLTPRLAVMLDVWPMVYHEDFLTITHVITTVAAQFWLTPQLWVKGGIGSAHAEFDYNGIFVEENHQTDTVAAVMGAIGFELYHRPNFAIDLQLRGGTGFYEDDEVKGHSAAFQVGFS